MAATVDWYDERGPRLARDFLDDVHIGFDSILETPAA